jgi:hypothetical protein
MLMVWDRLLEDRVIPLLSDMDRMRRQIRETGGGVQDFKRPGLHPE